VDGKANTVLFDIKFCQEDCLQTSSTGISGDSYPRHPDVSFVSAQAFQLSIKYPSSQLYAVTLKEVSDTLTTKLQGNYSKPGQVTSQDLEKQMLCNGDYDPVQEKEEVEKIIPPEYYNDINLFQKEGANKFPPHQYIDHTIDLVPRGKPLFGPLYSISVKELQVLKNYLEEHLSKGFIQASSSSAAALILFVKKSDGSIRVCLYYRALNDLTVKNRYPLPLINETL
jgi:hypothetical protein